ncbi:hypothetical protein GQ600_881 [Phytophthora cactorum]|nr:hypothetical protein GQ600_881 [Phytophthora cactorum]
MVSCYPSCKNSIHGVKTVVVWVQEITQEAYDRVFGIIQTLLAGQEYAPTPSSTDSADSTMNQRLRASAMLLTHFGLPTDTIQASNINLFQLQERSMPLRSDLGEAYSRRYGHYEGAAATKRRSLLLRPASPRQSRLSVYNSHNASPTPPPGSPSTSAFRTANPFLLAGTIALKPSHKAGVFNRSMSPGQHCVSNGESQNERKQVHIGETWHAPSLVGN